MCSVGSRSWGCFCQPTALVSPARLVGLREWILRPSLLFKISQALPDFLLVLTIWQQDGAMNLSCASAINLTLPDLLVCSTSCFESWKEISGEDNDLFVSCHSPFQDGKILVFQAFKACSSTAFPPPIQNVQFTEPLPKILSAFAERWAAVGQN